MVRKAVTGEGRNEYGFPAATPSADTVRRTDGQALAIGLGIGENYKKIPWICNGRRFWIGPKDCDAWFWVCREFPNPDPIISVLDLDRAGWLLMTWLTRLPGHLA